MAKEKFKTRKIGNLIIKTGDQATKQIVLTKAISQLDADDKEWMAYYEKQGYLPIPKRVIENSRTKKEKDFKELLTEEEFAQFQEIKKNGYTSKVKKDKNGKFKVYKPGYSAAVNWTYEQHPEFAPPKKEK